MDVLGMLENGVLGIGRRPLQLTTMYISHAYSFCLFYLPSRKPKNAKRARDIYVTWQQFNMNESHIQDRIWRIVDGVPLKLGNITIRTTDSDKLLVTGWTKTVHFENLKKDSLLKELEELKSTFSELVATFKELTTVIDKYNLIVEYHMAYDDAGKVGIGLCSELNGELNWYL